MSSLARKLRLEPNQRVAILNAPEGYLDSLVPGPADITTVLSAAERFDAVQLFVNGVDELRSLGPAAIRAVKDDGLLWVTYPKGDLIGAITSMLGNKPVALVKIDDSWTALRFNRLAAPASLDGSA